MRRALGANLPAVVTPAVRHDGEREIVFVTSFCRELQSIDLGAGRCRDRLCDQMLTGTVEMPAYGVFVLERTTRNLQAPGITRR